jgi:hypothetical protein
LLSGVFEIFEFRLRFEDNHVFPAKLREFIDEG